MSDLHIMIQGDKKKTVQVVLHIPVPDVTNQAGMSYRLALKQQLEAASETGVITSQYPNILVAEEALLQNGEVYEAVRAYRFSSINLTPVQKQAELDAFYTAASSTVLTEKQDSLEYWGYDRDVP